MASNFSRTHWSRQEPSRSSCSDGREANGDHYEASVLVDLLIQLRENHASNASSNNITGTGSEEHEKRGPDRVKRNQPRRRRRKSLWASTRWRSCFAFSPPASMSFSSEWGSRGFSGMVG
uniref:Uncharacterized protein n=1 Tax=Oryza meridionalis TaxID=40149 RepID=A0A0E0CMX9_9ORYZ